MCYIAFIITNYHVDLLDQKVMLKSKANDDVDEDFIDEDNGGSCDVMDDNDFDENRESKSNVIFCSF